MLTNYLHCTVPGIKKIITEVGNKYMIMVSTLQQFQTGWWDVDNFIPLTEVASFQASKFGTNMFKQIMRQNRYKPWVLVQ